MPSKEKIAVILVAHGEAETNLFTENYRVTRQTLAHASLVMPIPALLQRTIAVSSSLKKIIRARTDPRCSPQNRITRDQVAALQHYLDASAFQDLPDFEVHAAFSASPPYAESVIEATRDCSGQIIISMAPVDSSLSCGLLCSWLKSSRSPGELGNVRVLSRFWADEQLHRLYLDHLFQSCGDKPKDQPVLRDEERLLLLLFHGTLVSNKKGEVPPFRTGLEGTLGFAERLGDLIPGDSRNPYGRIMTVYLNHDVGGSWTTPSFSEICSQLQKESSLRVDLFACGYFSDGNETIRRADELRSATSVQDAVLIPCLNTSREFIAYLGDRVIRAARQITRLG
ncbi:ferrochelatase [Chlorobium sp. KB01]|uniref:ferrochelatase n=1 Tax=Chlorobium sp. KB01 TaxID=1917528 RepID=UPI00097778DE|nr:ferrochelatase [Chlorobium sp. KB01]